MSLFHIYTCAQKFVVGKIFLNIFEIITYMLIKDTFI